MEGRALSYILHSFLTFDSTFSFHFQLEFRVSPLNQRECGNQQFLDLFSLFHPFQLRFMHFHFDLFQFHPRNRHVRKSEHVCEMRTWKFRLTNGCMYARYVMDSYLSHFFAFHRQNSRLILHKSSFSPQQLAFFGQLLAKFSLWPHFSVDFHFVAGGLVLAENGITSISCKLTRCAREHRSAEWSTFCN